MSTNHTRVVQMNWCCLPRYSVLDESLMPTPMPDLSRSGASEWRDRVGNASFVVSRVMHETESGCRKWNVRMLATGEIRAWKPNQVNAQYLHERLDADEWTGL